MEEEEFFRYRISIDTVYNALITRAKYAHSVCGRRTLKDVERFRNWSVRDPYGKSLSDRTFTSEPFIEKHAISTELSNVDREKYQRKFIMYVDVIVNQAE